MTSYSQRIQELPSDRVTPVPPLRHPPNLPDMVADDLRRSIEAGAFEAGRLPSEPELARQLGVSRATLRHAITELEEAGLVRRHHGRGTFVTGHAAALRNILNENSGTTELITSAGGVPGTADVVPIVRIAARREQESLGLAAADRVIAVRRTRLTDGTPAVAVEDVMPERLLAAVGLTAERVAAELGHRSLYELLEEVRLTVHHGIVDIRATRARGDVARRLGLPVGSAVLALDQIDSTAEGVAVLLSHEWYAPDVFQFRVYRRGPGSRR